MRYAKIENNKVVDIVTGLQPEGSIDIKVKWVVPVEYPESFYYSKTNHPQLSIVGDEVHENWDFHLKPIDLIKADIYAKQKTQRQEMQLGSFDFGGVTITLKDREDSLIISSLPEVDTRYKVDQGVWATLTGVEVAALKDAHRVHVQAAYDWEEAENAKVAVIDNYDSLSEYYTELTNSNERPI